MIDVDDTGVATLPRLAHSKVDALDLELLREPGKGLDELEGSI